MNNLKIRNFVDGIFYSDTCNTITKKLDCKLANRLWYKFERPIECQISIPINVPIYNTVQSQND